MFGIPPLAAGLTGILLFLILVHILPSEERPLEEIFRGLNPRRNSKSCTDATSSELVLSSTPTWISPMIPESDQLMETRLRESSHNSQSHVNESGGTHSQSLLPLGIPQVGQRFESNIFHSAFPSQLSSICLPISSLLVSSLPRQSNSEQSTFYEFGPGFHTDGRGSRNSQTCRNDIGDSADDKQSMIWDGLAFQHDSQVIEHEMPVFQHVEQNQGPVLCDSNQVLGRSDQVCDERGHFFHGTGQVQHESDQGFHGNSEVINKNGQTLHGNGQMMRGNGHEILDPAPKFHPGNSPFFYEDSILHHKGKLAYPYSSPSLQKDSQKFHRETLWPLDGRGKRMFSRSRYPLKRHKTSAEASSRFPEASFSEGKKRGKFFKHGIDFFHRRATPDGQIKDIVSKNEDQQLTPRVPLGLPHMNCDWKMGNFLSAQTPLLSDSCPKISRKKFQPDDSLQPNSFLATSMSEKKPVIGISQNIIKNFNHGRIYPETPVYNYLHIDGLTNSESPSIDSFHKPEKASKNDLCTTETGIMETSCSQQYSENQGSHSMKYKDSLFIFEEEITGKGTSNLPRESHINENRQLEKCQTQAPFTTIIDDLETFEAEKSNSNNQFRLPSSQIQADSEALMIHNHRHDSPADTSMGVTMGLPYLGDESVPFGAPVEAMIEETENPRFGGFLIPKGIFVGYNKICEAPLGSVPDSQTDTSEICNYESPNSFQNSGKQILKDIFNEKHLISNFKGDQQQPENVPLQPIYKSPPGSNSQKFPGTIPSASLSSKELSKIITDEVEKIIHDKFPQSLVHSRGKDVEEKKSLQDIIPVDEVIKMCARKHLDIRKIQPVISGKLDQP